VIQPCESAPNHIKNRSVIRLVIVVVIASPTAAIVIAATSAATILTLVVVIPSQKIFQQRGRYSFLNDGFLWLWLPLHGCTTSTTSTSTSMSSTTSWTTIFHLPSSLLLIVECTLPIPQYNARIFISLPLCLGFFPGSPRILSCLLCLCFAPLFPLKIHPSLEKFIGS